MKTVIIGGVAGGASAAARLRRLDERAEIVILERGSFISYANCGLPYYVGGTIENRSALTLQTPESFTRRFNVDVRVRHEAVGIDPAGKIVTVRNLTDGRLYEESYDSLILSPGAEPIVPRMPGAECERIFTLRTIPDALAIRAYVEAQHPRSAVVVGGGMIGTEMAENLTAAGIAVTVVELQDHIIAPLDFEMAADVHQYLESRGIRLMLGRAVTAVEPQGEALRVKLGRETVDTDMLVLSVGVRPESDLAQRAGLQLTDRGAIVTDSHMRTSAPDIYAVGDAVQVHDFVTGDSAYVPLAGPANKQGRIAADNICGISSEYAGTQGSAVVKLFDMTVAVTGLNERAAQAKGIDYDKTYTYSASHAGYYPGATNMSIKILWERGSLRLLGAQIVGFEGVDKRMDVLATAIRLGAKVTDLKELELVYAPPFGSAKDPVNMAGYVAENVVTGKLKQFFWDQVDDLPRDGSVTLLDVRMPGEVAAGHIEGFRPIPWTSCGDGWMNCLRISLSMFIATADCAVIWPAAFSEGTDSIVITWPAVGGCTPPRCGPKRRQISLATQGMNSAESGVLTRRFKRSFL